MEVNKRKKPVPKKNYSLIISKVKQETSTFVSGSATVIPTVSQKPVREKKRHYQFEACVIVRICLIKEKHLIDINDYELHG